jgi:hypothetical protein
MFLRLADAVSHAMDILLGQGGAGRSESGMGSKIMRCGVWQGANILRFGAALAVLR